MSFVTAKSRDIPITKKHTIPRLELLGNLLLSKLVCNVSRALDVELKVSKIFCWTDSTISLSWIKSSKKEFKVFVQNRVNDIRKNVDMNDWYYRRSEVNPADIITKCGGDPKSVMWWNVRDFLYQVIFNPEGTFDCDISLPPEIMEEVSSSNYNSVLLASQENSNLISN